MLKTLLACSLILVGTISNAETVSVTLPTLSTDGNALAGLSLSVNFYQNGTCAAPVYCSDSATTVPGVASCIGAVLAKGTYTFSATVTNSGTGGGTSPCGGVTSYTYGGTFVPAAPGIMNIIRP